jgi:Flp pilus assembly protein TadD
MTLSLAMIVKNEAAHLGHCLDSVRGLVDEVVVVDTGSTDGTVAVAQERGARVGSFPWTGNFAEARNASLAQATGDWVLVLDADEALDARDFPLIRQACAQDRIPAFRLVIRNYLPDSNRMAMDAPAQPNPGGYTEGAAFAYCGDSRNLRLFRRLPGVAFQGRLHELVDFFFQERGLPVEDLGAVIHHYGQVLAERVEKKKPIYLEMALKDAQERPQVLEANYNLVMQAMAAEAWETACRAVETMRGIFPRELPAVIFVHALSLQYLERHGEALERFDELLRKVPGHPTGFVRRGVSLAVLGRTEEARKVFQKAIRRFPRFSVPVVHLAELEANLGDPGKARDILLEGLKAFPADASLWSRLVRLGVEHGQTQRAVQDAWTAIQRCPQGGEGRWHQLVGLALVQQGALPQGRAVLEMGLKAFPGNPDLARILEGL